MKALLIGCVVAFLAPSLAFAEFRIRTVTSGQTKRMAVHISWSKDCKSNGGAAKVLTRPQHGKLSNRIVDSTIQRNRTGSDTSCVGKTIKGFEVNYTSEPNFHGTDTFSLEVTTGSGKGFTDHYTVTVQ